MPSVDPSTYENPLKSDKRVACKAIGCKERAVMRFEFQTLDEKYYACSFDCMHQLKNEAGPTEQTTLF